MGIIGLYKYYAASIAAMVTNPYYDMGSCENPYNNYHPAKVGGFTECKGRKHLSKKKRKELNMR